MHPIRPRRALLAWILACCAPLPGLAQAPATDEAAIFESPAWREMAGRIRDDALHPVDEAHLRAGCHAALAAPPTAGRTPVDTCFDGAMAALVPAARYYSPTETAAFADDKRRGWVGIGVQLAAKARPGPLVVDGPTPDGPAARAGVRRGDRVLRIDGVDVQPLSTEQCVALMRGPAGAPATLDIERGAANDRLVLTMAREPLKALAVRRELLTRHVAALRVNPFFGASPDDIGHQLEQIAAAEGGAPDVLLVDLRGNTGGQLGAMLQVAGFFVNHPTVVALLVRRDGNTPLTPDFAPASHYDLPAPARQWLHGARIAVLVDERSGDGAEAFAVFLREQRGARIIGRRTIGHASTETLMRLPGNAAILVPSGEIRSVRQSAWSGHGITPDVPLPADPADARSPDDASADDTTFAAALRVL